MNIFWLDEDLEKAAEYHCDKHLGKMLVEAVQILCTALRQTHMAKAQEYSEAATKAAQEAYISKALDLDYTARVSREILELIPYKPTHPNRPCVKWVGLCTGNFKKLCLLATKLSNEFEHRNNKEHKTKYALKKLLEITELNDDLPFDDHIASIPPLVIKDTEILKNYHPGEYVEAYREYYSKKLMLWGEMSYTNRDIPTWLER